jgi:hypothetical protein
MQERKAGRGKIRSETVTVRLDQKLRYLAGLGARKQRRTLSSYIEWAIEVSLGQVIVEEGEGWNNTAPTTLADVSLKLWDVEEADRFAKLALRYPDLLTHHESIMWKVVREYGFFWRGNFDNRTDEWMWQVRQESLVWDRLRDHWFTINAIASGTLDKSSLPDYPRKRSEEPKEDSEPHYSSEPDSEDIPF